MTTGGWISMVLSVGAVTLLFGWCLYKVLTHNPPTADVIEESLQEPPDRPRSDSRSSEDR